MTIMRGTAGIRSAALAGVVAVSVQLGGCVVMPGKSHEGPLPPITAAQAELAALLERDVRILSQDIGPRHLDLPDRYALAADFIEQALRKMGHAVERQNYHVTGRSCSNLIVEMRGGAAPSEIIIIGAHYDTPPGIPGANDNGSGVAALLATARHLAGQTPDRTVRLVFFANEEPPYFQTEQMGSHVYARRCRERGENIVAMIALDGLGCFSDAPGSQDYPVPGAGLIYGDRGDFIAFVSDLNSTPLLRRVVGSFRKHAAFPSRGAGLPGNITGVGFSDHWSFWQFKYQAVMVTDTLPFRYEHYHRPSDTADKLDYERMARLVEGLIAVVTDLSKV
jgi:Zn-dependent M28 family amino/carboxypeptidase